MASQSQSSSKRSGYTENYFSIDDILTSQERISCTFDLPCYGLGYLDPGSDSKDLHKGMKMDLPFWLARSLCSKKKHIVDVEIPKQYRESYREILSADASVVDLHKLGPHYYTLGLLLLQFDTPDRVDIEKALLQAFQDRFRKIMDSSQNLYNEDTTSMTSKLDEMERHLFKKGQKGLNDFQLWETRATEKLKTSELVLNHRKRKRAALDGE